MTINANIMELFKSVNNEGCPFMEEREKGEIEIGKILTLDAYGIINGELGEVASMSFKEDSERFFFGGEVVVKKFRELEKLIKKAEMEKALAQGVPVKFDKRTSKNGKEYLTIIFFPKK